MHPRSHDSKFAVYHWPLALARLNFGEVRLKEFISTSANTSFPQLLIIEGNNMHVAFSYSEK